MKSHDRLLNKKDTTQKHIWDVRLLVSSGQTGSGTSDKGKQKDWTRPGKDNKDLTWAESQARPKCPSQEHDKTSSQDVQEHQQL